jgi:hypothetical protein
MNCNSAGFMTHQGDLNCPDMDDHHMNLNPPLALPCFLPPSTVTQIDLDSRSRLQPILSKRRRILQPQLQQQWSTPSRSSPPPSSHGQCSRPHPPSLLIPTATCQDDPTNPKTSPDISPKTVAPLPPPLLRPCHICHRRPTTRVMLDAYADCELCGERACYICLRECNAVGCNTTRGTLLSGDDSFHNTPEGGGGGGGVRLTIKDGYLYAQQQQQHQLRFPQYSSTGILRQRKICSCCAVEGLTETGEEIVWCLDCVRGRHPSWE